MQVPRYSYIYILIYILLHILMLCAVNVIKTSFYLDVNIVKKLAFCLQTPLTH